MPVPAARFRVVLEHEVAPQRCERVSPRNGFREVSAARAVPTRQPSRDRRLRRSPQLVHFRRSVAWQSLTRWIASELRRGVSALTGVELAVLAAIVSTGDSQTGRCDSSPEWLCKLANVSRESFFRALRRLDDGASDGRGQRNDAKNPRREPPRPPLGIVRRQWTGIEMARCELTKRDCDRHTRAKHKPGCEFHHGRIILWLEVATAEELAKKLAGEEPLPVRSRPADKPTRPPGYRSRGRSVKRPYATSETPSYDTSTGGACATSHSGSLVTSRIDLTSSSALCCVASLSAEVPAARTADTPTAPVQENLQATLPRAFDGFEGTRSRESDAPPARVSVAPPQSSVTSSPPAENAHGTESESTDGGRARAVPLPSQVHARELVAIGVLWARLGMPLDRFGRKALANRHDEGISLEDLACAAHGAAGCAFARTRSRHGPVAVALARGSVAEYAHRGRKRREREREHALAAAAEAARDRAFPSTARVRVVRPANDAPPRAEELARELSVLTPVQRAMTRAELERNRTRQLDQLELLAAEHDELEDGGDDVGEIPIISVRALIEEAKR